MPIVYAVETLVPVYALVDAGFDPDQKRGPDGRWVMTKAQITAKIKEHQSAIQRLKKQRRKAPTTLDAGFDPNQPRNEQGEWTEGGDGWKVTEDPEMKGWYSVTDPQGNTVQGFIGKENAQSWVEKYKNQNKPAAFVPSDELEQMKFEASVAKENWKQEFEKHQKMVKEGGHSPLDLHAQLQKAAMASSEEINAQTNANVKEYAEIEKYIQEHGMLDPQSKEAKDLFEQKWALEEWFENHELDTKGNQIDYSDDEDDDYSVGASLNPTPSGTNWRELEHQVREGPEWNAESNALNAWAHRALGQDPANLPFEERDALMRYTGTAYNNINDYLRGRIDWLNEAGHERIAMLDAAIERSRLPNDMTVFRRFGYNTANRISGYGVGHVFEDKGFGSTSINPERTGAFGRELVAIDVPRGYRALPLTSRLSQADTELEVLLRRNTRYQVVSPPNPTTNRPMRLRVIPDEEDR